MFYPLTVYPSHTQTHKKHSAFLHSQKASPSMIYKPFSSWGQKMSPQGFQKKHTRDELQWNIRLYAITLLCNHVTVV